MKKPVFFSVTVLYSALQSSTVMMKPSEMLVHNYQTSWCYISEDLCIHSHCFKNCRFGITIFDWL